MFSLASWAFFYPEAFENIFATAECQAFWAGVEKTKDPRLTKPIGSNGKCTCHRKPYHSLSMVMAVSSKPGTVWWHGHGEACFPRTQAFQHICCWLQCLGPAHYLIPRSPLMLGWLGHLMPWQKACTPKRIHGGSPWQKDFLLNWLGNPWQKDTTGHVSGPSKEMQNSMPMCWNFPIGRTSTLVMNAMHKDLCIKRFLALKENQWSWWGQKIKPMSMSPQSQKVQPPLVQHPRGNNSNGEGRLPPHFVLQRSCLPSGWEPAALYVLLWLP